MGYLGIRNLYQDPTIIQLFRECYALEKIDGTSAHILWKERRVHLHGGSVSGPRFAMLFDVDRLVELFNVLGHEEIWIHGEAYGGKIAKMRATYGDDLRFIAFDVRIGNCWLAVPQAEDVCKKLGLEFVYYTRIPATVEAVDAERDAMSVQAVRNGMGDNHIREGVVIRPLMELTQNNGERLITKHKREEFKERKHVPKVLDPEKAEILRDAAAIAEEWVTEGRLDHILQDIPEASGMEHTEAIVKAMIADVYKESVGEIVQSREVGVAIGRAAASLWKKRIREKNLDATPKDPTS